MQRRKQFFAKLFFGEGVRLRRDDHEQVAVIFFRSPERLPGKPPKKISFNGAFVDRGAHDDADAVPPELIPAHLQRKKWVGHGLVRPQPKISCGQPHA